MGNASSPATFEMADSNTDAGSTKEQTGSAPNGANRGNVSHRDQKGSNVQRGRGGRGGRGRDQGRGNRKGFGSKSNERGGRQKKGDMGRGEYTRANVDKRKRNDDWKASKRQKTENNGEDKPDAPFSKEEIEAEVRKPKRKVAVMIGYAGSGYKGMQINGDEKTIEGDLFKAFVAAGAISKANADDPKKSSLVRCARTDKGVHAAGNVISLKLIVEEPKIIDTINENLPPQIRVWGMERTNGSFSCYQSCDSRWYEYLIPTFAFLPPHPQSFLGRKLVESAEKEGVFETYQSLQEDVSSFWKNAEAVYVKPILEKFDLETRAKIMSVVHSEKDDLETDKAAKQKHTQHADAQIKDAEDIDNTQTRKKTEDDSDKNEDLVDIPQTEERNHDSDEIRPALESQNVEHENTLDAKTRNGGAEDFETKDSQTSAAKVKEHPVPTPRVLSPVELAIKEVKAAYNAAKKAYRISPSRRERVQEALNRYVGTRNFHNYTIQKHFNDASAKRHIRSFNVQPEPVIINDTEWLSLKVHGQSFMMHQIRKMVAMVALVVRCGTPMNIIQESYGPATISIPKAPGLGLLLEAPVFESYNERAINEFKRETIDFNKYSKEMLEFKQREIYDRIFREEEKDHQFHDFFHHVDHYRTDYFLWVTASGLAAAKQSQMRKGDDASDDEADANGEEG